jgi:hypothetical protein
VLAVYHRALSEFGPTLASEVSKEQSLLLSPYIVGRWLLAAGLWKQVHHRDQQRSRRLQRECYGELI